MKPEEIKSAAKDFGAAAGKNADDAKQTLNEKVTRLGAQAQDFADQASASATDMYGRAKDQVRTATDAMPDTAADAIAAGHRAYDKGAAKLSHHVAKQPLEALILAAAIGYLVGWATTRG